MEIELYEKDVPEAVLSHARETANSSHLAITLAVSSDYLGSFFGEYAAVTFYDAHFYGNLPDALPVVTILPEGYLF